MFYPASVILALFSWAHILALLAALWLAFRFEPRVTSVLYPQQSSSLTWPIRTIVWALSASLFGVFFSDCLGLTHTLLGIISPPSWGLAEGAVSTIWGSAPPRLFDALSAATTLAIYTAASVVLWRSLGDRPSSILATLAESSAERLLLVFACAGLVNLILGSLIEEVVFVQLPSPIGALAAGVPGFAGGWLLGVLLVLVSVALFGLRLQGQGD
jgi:hypothetical protein